MVRLMACFEVPSRWEFEAEEKKGWEIIMNWRRSTAYKKVYLVNGGINYFFGCSSAKEQKKKNLTANVRIG